MARCAEKKGWECGETKISRPSELFFFGTIANFLNGVLGVLGENQETNGFYFVFFQLSEDGQ